MAEEKSAEEKQAEEQKIAQEQKDQEKANISKVTPEQILEMDVSDLDKVDEHLTENPETFEGDEAVKGEEKTEEQTAEGDETKKAEAEEAKKAEDLVDPKDKIIADQKAEITKLQQERSKRESEQIDSEWINYEEPTKEDLDLLYDEDREAYDIAVDRQNRYKQYTEKKSLNDIESAHTENSDAVLGFLADLKGLEFNDGTKSEMIKALKTENSEEVQLMTELDNYLNANIKPARIVKAGKDEKGNDQYLPVYSKKQIRDAYNTLHFNDIVKAREDKIKSDTAKQIEDASKGGSVFDRVEPSKTDDTKSKKPDEYTQQELQTMSEEQLAHVEKMYDFD